MNPQIELEKLGETMDEKLNEINSTMEQLLKEKKRLEGIRKEAKRLEEIKKERQENLKKEAKLKEEEAKLKEEEAKLMANLKSSSSSTETMIDTEALLRPSERNHAAHMNQDQKSSGRSTSPRAALTDITNKKRSCSSSSKSDRSVKPKLLESRGLPAVVDENFNKGKRNSSTQLKAQQQISKIPLEFFDDAILTELQNDDAKLVKFLKEKEWDQREVPMRRGRLNCWIPSYCKHWDFEHAINIEKNLHYFLSQETESIITHLQKVWYWETENCRSFEKSFER